MDSEVFNIILDYINIVFLVFSGVLFLMFGFMGYFSTRSSLHYQNKNSFGDLSKVMASPLAPSITIIAPAYNEGLTIVENIRSLLSLQYVNYEVMVVNDGSKDDTLQKMIDAYDLIPIEKKIDPNWKSKPIRGIYKSKHQSFSKNSTGKLVFKAFGGTKRVQSIKLSKQSASHRKYPTQFYRRLNQDK